MKFSEILKQDFTPKRPAPEAPRPAVPRPPQLPKAAPVSQPPPAPAPKPAASAPQPAAPAPPDRSALEKQVRDNVEKEFLGKLEKMENDLLRLAEEKLKLQEQVHQDAVRARESEFEKKMRAEKEALEAASRRLEEERVRQEEELKKQALEREREKAEKERLAAEAARKLEADRKAFEEKTRRDLETAQRKIVELEQKKHQEIVAQPPLHTGFMLASPPADKKEPMKAPPSVSAGEQEELRAAYAALIAEGDRLFKKILEKQPFTLEETAAHLSKIIELAANYDQELITITCEPYAEVDYFSAHAANCAIVSIIVGCELKMPSTELLDLGLASFIHDVGLLGIRENLDYPKELTQEIRSEVLKHPERTVEILGEEINDAIKAAILQHHETVNGKGYPKGLTGDKIHPYAKIIHISDSFEAMTHQRPYRTKPLEVNEALKEMIDRGRHVYDRDILKALMGRIGLYPVGSLVELSNKQIGRVLRQSKKHPISPVIQIDFDEEGAKIKEPAVMDLSKNPLVHIVGPVVSIHSYGKEKMEHHHREPQSRRFDFLRDVVPYIFLGLFILLLIYIFFKV